MISRRKFLFASSVVATSALAIATPTFAAIRDTTSDLSLSKNEVIISSLDGNFDGYKIALITDPHLGNCSSSELLIRAIELLSKEKFDLLVLGGDYLLMLDSLSNRLFYNSSKQSRKLQTCNMNFPSFKDSLAVGEHYFKEIAHKVVGLNPTDGIVAVLGNHDRWNSGENCCKVFKSAGIEALVNRTISLSRGKAVLEIFGCDDYSTGIPEMPSTGPATKIIVSHNPDYLFELAQIRSFGLGLAGHTHGGQINLPIIGPQAINIQYPELIRGLTRVNDSQVFVSSGVGTSGMPWRINCPPEINLLTLRCR